MKRSCLSGDVEIMSMYKACWGTSDRAPADTTLRSGRMKYLLSHGYWVRSMVAGTLLVLLNAMTRLDECVSRVLLVDSRQAIMM